MVSCNNQYYTITAPSIS